MVVAFVVVELSASRFVMYASVVVLTETIDDVATRELMMAIFVTEIFAAVEVPETVDTLALSMPAIVAFPSIARLPSSSTVIFSALMVSVSDGLPSAILPFAVKFSVADKFLNDALRPMISPRASIEPRT